jgi:hypothetical protein
LVLATIPKACGFEAATRFVLIFVWSPYPDCCLWRGRPGLVSTRHPFAYAQDRFAGVGEQGQDALATILQFCSIASVVSAGRADLPKQKPNKKQAASGLFLGLGISILIAAKIWDGA